MSKHTPGEWVASGNGVHKGTRCVATTHMEPKEQRDTDARLIAAAPDLLEALQRLVMAYEVSHSAKTRGRCWEQARAAIAKATGEQQ